MPFVNQEQAQFWSAAAANWIESEGRLEKTAGPPGRMAMERLDPQPGERLLDLGCGTGPTTVELAALVGQSGSVVGVDIAEEMLARARQRADEGGVQNVSFVHADVQAAPVASQEYDGAFSRFGVMFYSDPAAAFANVRRALRPGGRLSFVCWQEPMANEWMVLPGAAVRSVTGFAPPPPPPDAPGPFSLCDTQRIRSILESAGFRDIDVVPHSDHVTADEEEIPRFAAMSLGAGAAREALKDADEDTRERARQAVVDVLKEKVVDGQMRLARGVLITSART